MARFLLFVFSCRKILNTLMVMCFVSWACIPLRYAVLTNQWTWDEQRSVIEGTNVRLWWSFGLAADENFSYASVDFLRRDATIFLPESVAAIIDTGLNQTADSRMTIVRKENNVTFVLRNVVLSDEGRYTIDVSTTKDYGGKRKTTHLEVTVPPVIDLTKPMTRKVSRSENDSFTLFCNATGKPAPTISWRKAGGAQLQFPDGSTLTVNKAVPEHNGTYQCTATNKAGSSRNIAFDVIIYYKPSEVKLTSQSGPKVRWGTTINLACDLGDVGNPAAHYTFYVESQTTAVFQSSSSVYSFVFTESDSYHCEGNNTIGGSGKSSAISFNVYDPPQVNLALHTAPVLEGDDVSLICSVTGIPQPMVTWSRLLSNKKSSENISPIEGVCTSSLCLKANITNGKPAPGDRFLVEDVLALFSVSDDMEGYYTCTGSSAEGSNIATRVIDIKYEEAGTSQSKLSPPISGLIGFIVVNLVVVIVGAVVRKVKKKRSDKDRKATGNGEGHRMKERQTSDPTIEARAGGYNNPALDHHNVELGPTATYAEPGKVMYADSAEVKTEAATQSTKPSEGQQHKSTDIMQRKEGEIKKVAINAPATGSEPPEGPTDEKAVKDDTGTQATPDGEKGKTSTETGDETANSVLPKGTVTTLVSPLMKMI